MIVDSHAHLIDPKMEDTAAVLEKAKKNDVEKIVTPTTAIEEFDLAIDLANRFNNVYPLLGVHPENVERVEAEKVVQEIKKRLTETRVVGIGEIGLDFYWDTEKRTENKQRELFRAQMDIAVMNNLPAAIHMREAEVEMKSELLKRRACPRGQFHCFAGSLEFLELILSKGFYVSFCGNVTYKSAEKLRELLRRVPLERLLLETDSPYLPPEPHRGTVNSPANVKIIAEFVASELGVGFEELTYKTSENATCLYSLEN